MSTYAVNKNPTPSTFRGSKARLEEKFKLFANQVGQLHARMDIDFNPSLVSGQPRLVQDSYRSGYQHVARQREEVTG